MIYLIAGQDAVKNQDLMRALKSQGVYEISKEMKENLDDFAAGYATEDQVKKTISEIYKSTGYVIDTHTAVADIGWESNILRKTKDERKTVIASTASPYKLQEV